jgi:cytochrome bd-type quinol oxidase subunit 2
MNRLLAQGTKIGGDFNPIGAYAPDVANGSAVAAEQFTKFASNLIGLLTTVGGLMFMLYFILGGLSWITAGGDKAKVDDAKAKMTNAAIGLIIIVAAYAIGYIVGEVLGIKILEPAEILKTLDPSTI